MDVEILKYDHMGNGIAKIDGKTIFIKRAIPNELVNIKIIKEKKNFSNAIISNIIKPSNNRIKPICPYYDKCGGCDFLHTTNNEEQLFKENKCSELLNNNYTFYNTKELNYRNKITLHVKNNKIGLYEEQSNKIIQINNCYLVDEKINKIINKLQQYYLNKKCNLNEIIIKSSQETLIYLKGNIDNNFLKEFDFIDNIILNNKTLKGNNYITTNLCNYNFKISDKSFFQVNYQGLIEISKILENNLKNNHYKQALDLYSGTSVMGILISKYADKVISIEYNKSSTDDALINIKNNNINNIKVINGKVEDHIDNYLDSDLVIVDPPRSGLDKKTIDILKKINSNNIIYISCDMISLKRDLQLLDTYKIKSIDLVNMFPKTYHVETVCLLSRSTV